MPGHKLTTNGDYARLDSLLCPWCNLILREALQTDSGVRLCQTCYNEIQGTPDYKNPVTGNEVLLEPNESYHPDNAVRKEVNKLIVKCANHNQGCPWFGPLKKHEDEHIAKCQYHTVQCENAGCEVEILLSKYMEHKLQDCLFRRINCKHCRKDLLAKDEELHVESCPYAPEQCNSCGEYLRRDKVKVHESLECLSTRLCTGCEREVSLDAVNTHLSNPPDIFEHFQTLGVKIYHIDRSKQELEEVIKAARDDLHNERDKISGLQESLPDVLKMKKMFANLQALGGGEGVLPYLNKLEQDVKEMKGKVQKQDQIIASLKGTSASGAGSSQPYHPSNLPSSNMEEYPPGDRLSYLERKVEEVERQTAMLKVHMSELELQLQASLASTYNGSFLWRIPEVKKRKRDAIDGRITSIYSPPFYTGRNGYKMCIRAYLNGDGIGYNTHLSIFFVLMKGEYDPLLKWPFDYKVSLIMVDQAHRRHIVQTFKPSPSSGSFQQPKSDMNIASGCPKFADLKVLENEDYVKEDVLYIKCIVDVARIFHP